MNSNLKYIIGVFSVFILITLFSLDLFSSIGVGLFLFFGTKLFLELGERIEIKDIMILLAVLQWVIGPLLAYKIYPDDDFYYMAVDIMIYMKYVVPASLAFAVGLYLPIWKNKHSENEYLSVIKQFVRDNKNIDIILILIGIISELLIDFVPLNIRFVMFLFSGLRFIGLYFLFLSNRRNKLFFIYAMLGWLFLTALRETLFHDLLLWLGFFVVIVSFIVKPSSQKKIIFLIVGFFLVVAIQTVKHSFRDAIKEGNNGGVALFLNLVKEKVVDSDYATSETNLSAMVVRINQGWIIARIMSWTPSREPFANGETINEAIKSSFMPRVLFPDKVTAGGRTYFTRFTGKNISDQTSMGLGLVGEAYANYGVFGGIFFMFVIGFFYNFFLSRIYKIANKHPAIIFFIPLIFLQVIKAETDFSVILNYLIKATVVVWAIFFSLRRFLNIKI